MRRPSTTLFCLLLTLVAVTGTLQCAWAQEVTASITGTVTDPSGAAVPGANVTATSQERGVTFTAVTNDSGLYRVAQLPVGNLYPESGKVGFCFGLAPGHLFSH